MVVKCKKMFRSFILYILVIVMYFSPITSSNSEISGIVTATVSAATGVEQPAASPKQGSILFTHTIKLTCDTKGAVIYYTTNGTKPTTKSKKYSKPFTLSKNSILRAVAIKNNRRSTEYVAFYNVIDYSDIANDVKRYQTAIEDNQISRLTEEDQRICRGVKSVITRYIKGDMSTYEKVKTIHDYIINNTKYDYDNYTIGSIPDDSYSITGVMLDGTAVCQGYAETFQLFMNLLGISSKFITGTADGDSHAWNLVKINKKWYHVDTTWDDPYSEERETLTYNYFLISDTWIAKDHRWNSSKYPSCVSDDMMYLVYDEYIISSVNQYQEKFTELYKKGKREITILYPENKIPDFNFYFTLTGKNKISYSNLSKFGKYYMLTVYAE